MTALEALADTDDQMGGNVRYLIARGIVENRLGLYESALATLNDARRKARATSEKRLLPRISRETARVRAWRSDVKGAALELLRAASEAHATGDEREIVATLAEGGRLNLEAGRYQAALEAFDEAVRFADLASPREAVRTRVNRCEALVATEQWQECLDALADIDFESGSRRDRFKAHILGARASLETGRPEQAAGMIEAARRLLATGESSFAGAELAVVEALACAEQDPEAAGAKLEGALARFADDNLPRFEIDTHLVLTRHFAGSGEAARAEHHVLAALRRADTADLPTAADRARARALAIWPSDRIESLPAASNNRARRFLVLESLGSGGFGSVRRAVDLDSGAEVALKRVDLAASADPGLLLTTIRNEIAGTRNLAAGIAARTRYVHAETKTRLLLVQDFVPGRTLRATLDGDALSEGQRREVAARLVRVVGNLHAAGVAHRDLKPANVILRDSGEPVLIDLGLAAARGATAVTGVGTPRYMAPELASGSPQSVDAFGCEDLYALGVMLRELVGVAEPRGFMARLTHKPGDVEVAIARLTATEPRERRVDLDDLARRLASG